MSEEEIKEQVSHTKSIIKEGLESDDDIQLILMRWLDLYQKEKERAERHKQLYLMEKDYQENKLNEYLTDKICERQFELQQEYKDFEDDIRLNTLQEIHRELLEENNGEND
jgi:hypothetical protein